MADTVIYYGLAFRHFSSSYLEIIFNPTPEVNLYEDDNNNVTYGDITVHNARGYYDCENFNGLIAHCYTLL